MSYLPDILLVAGAGLVSFGAWLVYAPAGFVVAGCFALGFGYMLAKSAAK